MVNIILDLKIGIKVSRLLKMIIFFMVPFSIFSTDFLDSSKISVIHQSVKKNNPVLNRLKRSLFTKDTSLDYCTLFQINKKNKPKSVKLDSTGGVCFDFGYENYYWEIKSKDTLFIYVLKGDIFYSGIYLIKSKFLFLTVGPSTFMGVTDPPEYLGFIVSYENLNKFYLLYGEDVSFREYINKTINISTFPIKKEYSKYFSDNYYKRLTIKNLVDITKVVIYNKPSKKKKKCKTLFDYYFDG